MLQQADGLRRAASWGRDADRLFRGLAAGLPDLRRRPEQKEQGALLLPDGAVLSGHGREREGGREVWKSAGIRLQSSELPDLSGDGAAVNGNALLIFGMVRKNGGILKKDVLNDIISVKYFNAF